MKKTVSIKLTKNVTKQIKLISEYNDLPLNRAKNFKACFNIYKSRLN